MGTLKIITISLVSSAITGGLVYHFMNKKKPEVAGVVEPIKIQPIEVPKESVEICEAQSCPVCPIIDPKVVYRTIIKDRIVYVDQQDEPGCHVDWRHGKAKGVTVQGNDLKCYVDYERRLVNTVFKPSKRQRPLREFPENYIP